MKLHFNPDEKRAILDRIEAAILRIKLRRAREDAAFEDKWRERYASRPWWLRCLIGPMEPTPDALHPFQLDGPDFPSIYAWGTLLELEHMRDALEQHDGPFELTAYEMDML